MKRRDIIRKLSSAAKLIDDSLIGIDTRGKHDKLLYKDLGVPIPRNLERVQLELYFKLLKGILERIGGEMIRTKFSATVTNTGQGLEVTSSDIGNLYILVKDKSELESQCRRIFAEMSELSPDSFDLQFIFN